jgi:hypothetical protein
LANKTKLLCNKALEIATDKLHKISTNFSTINPKPKRFTQTTVKNSSKVLKLTLAKNLLLLPPDQKLLCLEVSRQASIIECVLIENSLLKILQPPSPELFLSVFLEFLLNLVNFLRLLLRSE